MSIDFTVPTPADGAIRTDNGITRKYSSATNTWSIIPTLISGPSGSQGPTGLVSATAPLVYDSAARNMSLAYGYGLIVVAETLYLDTSLAVTTDATQTLTNKTITAPILTLNTAALTSTVEGRISWDGVNNVLKIGDGSAVRTISPDNIPATLTNKIIDISAGSNTITNIPNSSLLNSAVTVNGVTVDLGASKTITAGNPYPVTFGNGIANTTGNTYDGTLANTISIDTTVTVDKTTAQALQNKSLYDTSTWIIGAADNTKRLNISVAGNTTNITGTLAAAFTTAKTLTLPDITDTLVTKTSTDTLVNKTLDRAVVGATTSNTDGALAWIAATDQLTIGNGTGQSTFTSDTGATTLTNKTISLPIIDNFKMGYTTTATAAGTTTLTAASNQQQYFTGTTTQTVVLPVTSTLVLGEYYEIFNNSTGAVTVQSSGANNILVMPANTAARFTVILTTGTTAASWSAAYFVTAAASAGTTGTGAAVLATSPALTTPTISGSLVMSNGALATGQTAITGITATAGVGTYATTNTQYLTNGQTIVITGATSASYNGTYTITAVTANTNFTVTYAGNITAATGNGTTVVYTCTNQLYVGQIVTITGLTTTTGASLNLTSQTITAVSGTSFTINNTTVGTATGTQTGKATPVGTTSTATGTNNFLVSDTTTFQTSMTDANVDYLKTRIRRVTGGADWTTVQWRLQRTVDVTDMGYLAFGSGASSVYDVRIGSGNTDIAVFAPTAITMNQPTTITDPKLNLALNAQTGTTYTPVLTDNGQFITLYNAAAITFSIPLWSTTNFPVGAQIHLIQTGAGQVTIQAATAGTGGNQTSIYSVGATAATPKTRVTYSAATCVKIQQGTAAVPEIWYVFGDII